MRTEPIPIVICFCSLTQARAAELATYLHESDRHDLVALVGPGVPNIDGVLSFDRLPTDFRNFGESVSPVFVDLSSSKARLRANAREFLRRDVQFVTGEDWHTTDIYDYRPSFPISAFIISDALSLDEALREALVSRGRELAGDAWADCKLTIESSQPRDWKEGYQRAIYFLDHLAWVRKDYPNGSASGEFEMVRAQANTTAAEIDRFLTRREHPSWPVDQ